MWLVICWVCADQRRWHRSETLEFGMEGKPFLLGQFFIPSRIWLRYSFLEGKTLFKREPSAITASSGGRREWRRDPDKTQCESEGLRAADLYDDQD